MSNNTNHRTVRLGLRLSEDMNKRLDSIANDIGVPPSTLCALAVGEYVSNKERLLKQELLVSENNIT